jgi:hypothetical protein
MECLKKLLKLQQHLMAKNSNAGFSTFFLQPNYITSPLPLFVPYLCINLTASNATTITNNDQETARQKVRVTFFEVLSLYLNNETEEHHEKSESRHPVSGQSTNLDIAQI